MGNILEDWAPQGPGGAALRTLSVRGTQPHGHTQVRVVCKLIRSDSLARALIELQGASCTPGDGGGMGYQRALHAAAKRCR